MNIRCNCGYYYNTDVYNNVCPECEQTYEDKKKETVEDERLLNPYVDIDKVMNGLAALGRFYKGGKLDFK